MTACIVAKYHYISVRAPSQSRCLRFWITPSPRVELDIDIFNGHSCKQCKIP